MAAATAAIIAVAGTAYSANQANKQAKAAYKHAKGEAGRQAMYDKKAIEAVQRSPAAMFAPVMMGFATDVFGKAFAQHGIKMPVEQMKNALGIDRIIRNNEAGLPWNFSDEQYESEKTKQRGLARRTGTLGGVAETASDLGGGAIPRAGLGGGNSGQYAEWYTNGEAPPRRQPTTGPGVQSPAPDQPGIGYAEAATGAYSAPTAPTNQNLQPMTANESGYAAGLRGIK